MPLWETRVEWPRANIACDWREDAKEYASQPELATARVEIAWRCEQLQREGTATLHACWIEATCVHEWQGQELRGEPVTMLPEPSHALVSGLVLLALLARWRRR